MGQQLFPTAQLASIPTTGAGWTYMLSKANQDAGTPNLANIDSIVQTYVFAAAVCYKRNGSGLGLSYIQGKLAAVPGTEKATTQPLNPYRQGLWILIADLIDYPKTTQINNTNYTGTFADWVRLFIDEVLPGQVNWNTARKCAELSGNNWGAYARMWVIIAAIYLGDTVLRNLAIGWFARWLGCLIHPITGATLPNTFVASGNFSTGWDGPTTVYPTSQGAINPVSTNADLDGANAEDASRGSTAPPLVAAGASYSMEAADAALVTAMVIHQAGIVDTNGLPVWSWADNALKRHAVNTNRYALYPTSNHIYWHEPYFYNHVYGLTLPTQAENYAGRGIGFGQALTASGSTFLKTTGTTGGGGTTTPTIVPPTAHVSYTVPTSGTVHADLSTSTVGSAPLSSYLFELLNASTGAALRTSGVIASPTYDFTGVAAGGYNLRGTATATDGGSDPDVIPINVTTNQPPSAKLTATTPVRGKAPLTVGFDTTGSADPEGATITRTFDPGDGTPPFAVTAAAFTYTYGTQAVYPANLTAKITVSDGTLTATDIATITVDDPAGATTTELGMRYQGRAVKVTAAPTSSSSSSAGTASPISWPVGTWWNPVAGQSTGQPANGDFRGVGFALPKAVTIDSVFIEVTTAGSAGALLRLGLYNANDDLYPTTLVSDWGTVDAATTGGKTIALGAAQTIPAGYYFIGSAVQGAPATAPTVRIANALPRSSGGSTGLLAAGATGGYLQTNVTGALPATFTTTITSTSVIGKVEMHRTA